MHNLQTLSEVYAWNENKLNSGNSCKIILYNFASRYTAILEIILSI